MRIVLTKHSRERTAQRGIPLSWITQTLENPVAIAKGSKNKEIAVKDFGAKVVEVVFVTEENKKIVISVRWG